MLPIGPSGYGDSPYSAQSAFAGNEQAAGRNRDAFIHSLAVAGEDGTFEKRFRNNNLRGRVFGKSGYIAGVSCLSGYVKTESGQWFAFSILMNGITDNGTAKALQERIVAAIDDNAK